MNVPETRINIFFQLRNLWETNFGPGILKKKSNDWKTFNSSNGEVFSWFRGVLAKLLKDVILKVNKINTFY